jgi:uncharacterized protein (TIGR02246 family)
LVATAVLVGQETKIPKSAPAKADQAMPAEFGPGSEPIREILRQYVEAFNKHDAKALAALWTAKGIYVDHTTGERLEGRTALESDFAATFKEKASGRLSGNVQNVRFIRPDIASAEGEAVFTPKDNDDEPNKTSFTAILVKQDGRWLIDSIEESDVLAPPTASAALKDLEWMVGHWVDKSDQVRADTTCRWSHHRAFLIRSFTMQPEEDSGADQGTEVIGWDPRAKQIRSWLFLSDGSFGEATWTKVGNDWMRRGSQTLSDGRSASATQIISRVNDNTLTVQVIGKEIDGEPQISGNALEVVRVQDGQSSTGPEQSPSTATEKKEAQP